MAEFDVLVVGCGVVGASIARELSRYDVRVAVLEKELDVSQGASKGNSGCVHGGYDAKHGTLKSRLSRKGNQMFDKLDSELNFGFDKCGSLVLAFTPEEEKKLKELIHNGELNGVHDLEILNKEEVLAKEPHISIGVRSALYCPSAGVISPYEYCFALTENAIFNGVDLRVGQEVTDIQVLKELKTKETVFQVTTGSGEVLRSRFVVNCAGIHADKIGSMVNPECGYTIQPRKGQYVLLDKTQACLCNSILFQTPTKQWGKGVLVTKTRRGNLLLGPNASEEQDKEDKNTDIHELAYIAWAARRIIPHLDSRHNLKLFAGIRARSSRGDFIIEEDSKVKGFIHVAGIESPGLTSSPAIALMVKDILKLQCGIVLKPNPKFNPIRKHPVDFTNTNKEEIICKCEQISRGEIINAINSAGISISCVDSLALRTRAGLGTCQGARCRHLVAEILSEKNGVLFSDISKQLPGIRSQNRILKKDLSRL